MFTSLSSSSSSPPSLSMISVPSRYLSPSSIARNPILFSPLPNSNPFIFTARPSPSPFFGFSIQKKRKFSNGVQACSTSPFLGRVGSQRREGQASLLSFGINHTPTAAISEAATKSSDSSQVLSALLPFVVAATAIAALAQPATFTWSVYYLFIYLFIYF